MERVGGVEPHSAQLGRLATHLVLTRLKLADPEELESPTSWFVAKCSIQLS